MGNITPFIRYGVELTDEDLVVLARAFGFDNPAEFGMFVLDQEDKHQAKGQGRVA